MTAITANSSSSRMGQGKGLPSAQKRKKCFHLCQSHAQPLPGERRLSCPPLPLKATLSCSPNPETNLSSSSTSEEGEGERETEKVHGKHPEKETQWKILKCTQNGKQTQNLTARPLRESGGRKKNVKAFTRSNKDSILNSSPSSQPCWGVWRQILGLTRSRNPKALIPKATEDSTIQTNLRKQKYWAYTHIHICFFTPYYSRWIETASTKCLQKDPNSWHQRG